MLFSSFDHVPSHYVLARLKVKAGELTLIETPDGYELTAWDPESARSMEAGRKVMREYSEVFRTLGKS